MDISPTVGMLIMLNNYLHDVATAMLASSGVALWIIIKKYEKAQKDTNLSLGDGTSLYFLSIYTSMTKVARFSIYWILIGGVPRTLAYRSFEWSNAVGNNQVLALIIQHILAFAFVGTGIHLWLKVNKKIKRIKGN